jgi:pilus assembly protein CpaF
MKPNDGNSTDGVGKEDERFGKLKAQLHEQLVAGIDLNALGRLPLDELRGELRRVAQQLCQMTPELLNLKERDRLVSEVLDETLGLGPLEPLLADHSVTDILINGYKTVYVESGGRLRATNATFTDERHLLHIIQRIVSQVGRRVDEASPMVDARLSDGSRFNAIIPPLALDGALVSIRRFGVEPLRVEDLLKRGSATPEMLAFLEACVKARVNMVISGGTGAGKTTLLNALSAFIPDDERIITIEDAAELRLQQPHVGRLESRPRNIEGSGEITTRDLVRNSLRMRPDRIIVGECRGPEALDMLQAMNTGHEGSLTTVHANDTRDAIGRLEMMVGMAGFEIPIWVIRRQIASAIHVVVQVSRLLGGDRKIVRISEVTGMEGDNFSMQDLFVYRQTGVDEQRRAQGYFEAGGVRPKCSERLDVFGVGFPPQMFERRRLEPAPAAPADRGAETAVRDPATSGKLPGVP